MRYWKQAEATVYKYFSEKKGSFIHRFIDTHDINAQLNRFKDDKPIIYTEKKPSDFIVIEDGITFFAEVKSTENVKGVTSALFKEQEGMRKRILKVNGLYFYFIYSLFNKCWYKVPGEIIEEKENRKWEELEQYKVDYLKCL